MAKNVKKTEPIANGWGACKHGSDDPVGDPNGACAACKNREASMALVGTEKMMGVISELDIDAADNLRSSFDVLFAKAAEWIKRANEIRVTSSGQTREMKLARESRLALKDIRVEAEKTRKALKEDSLRWGRAIDGMCNVLKGLVEPIEAYLLEQETFAEREEEKKRAALRVERFQVLDSYGADTTVYGDLGTFTEEQWTNVAETARVQRDARVEAERVAAVAREEADRVAIAEREAVAKRMAEQEAENARLRAESAKKDRELRVEREKRAAVENAEAARIAKEKKLAADEEALLMAPDREKLRAFEASLRALVVPVLTSRHGRMAQKKLQAGMTEMIAWVKKVSEEL